MTIYWFIVLPVELAIADAPYDKRKMCWGSYQILKKMIQATHLPISIVTHIKFMKTTIFFWKNINSCRIFQILQKEC